jgi:hypothetical protein
LKAGSRTARAWSRSCCVSISSARRPRCGWTPPTSNWCDPRIHETA